MNNTKRIILCTILAILIISGVSLGVFVFYNKQINNENTSNNISDNTNTEDGTDIITNEEVKTLYNYVKASLKSNNVCLGYFYQNPFSNHTLENKITLVLINYAYSHKKPIDEDFLQKIPEEERELIKNNSEYYIESNIIKEGMKFIYNIDVDQFDDAATYYWDYRSDVDAFLSVSGGGAYSAEVIQKIIDYNETENEIAITEVKAEFLEFNVHYENEIQPAGIYRYVNNKNTLVMESNNFELTDDIISKLPQIKYIFKKNDAGNYYLSDIVNLNYQEDYADC